jgi:putative endonuclease
MLTIGELGERLVGRWLVTKQAKVLHYRWRIRRAEIDIIAEKDDGTLLFIEVKTRGLENWDENGLLSITPKKRIKILYGAEMFLGLHPEFTDRACRFDIALVRRSIETMDECLYAGRTGQGEHLYLLRYLPGAFESV